MSKPMSKTRKYMIYLFVTGLLAAFAVALWWVRTRTDKEMKAEVLNQMSQVEAIMSQSQKENVALLSLKYGIDKARVEKILDTYQYKHDVAYRVNKDIAGGRNSRLDRGAHGGFLAVDLDFGATIDNLSVQHEVPKDRLASLIADHKMLSRLEKDNALEIIGGYDVWNLRVAYAGFAGWIFSGGIKNLFDRDPPFSNQTQNLQVGYDPGYADPHGRLYWAGVRYAFKELALQPRTTTHRRATSRARTRAGQTHSSGSALSEPSPRAGPGTAPRSCSSPSRWAGAANSSPAWCATRSSARACSSASAASSPRRRATLSSRPHRSRRPTRAA